MLVAHMKYLPNLSLEFILFYLFIMFLLLLSPVSEEVCWCRLQELEMPHLTDRHRAYATGKLQAGEVAALFEMRSC